MNRLTGEIKSITTEGNLSMVGIGYEDITLKTVIIEKPGSVPYLKIGNKINVLFKETEVVIGLNIDRQVSLQNRVPCTIKKIDKGKLLSKLILNCYHDEIISIISTHAVDEMELKEGMQVTALVKTNEIMLSE